MAPKISTGQLTQHQDRMRRLREFKAAEDRREKAALAAHYEQMAKLYPDLYKRTAAAEPPQSVIEAERERAENESLLVASSAASNSPARKASEQGSQQPAEQAAGSGPSEAGTATGPVVISGFVAEDRE